MNRILALALVGVMAIALSACAPSPSADAGKQPPVASVATSGVAPTIGASGGATFEKFSKVKLGMTYEQVVQIMGNGGGLRNNPNPTADDKGPTKPTPHGTMVYAWISSTQGNNNVMHVTFVNNRVTAKDQAGLP
jgi:hypothetical protein